MKVVGREVLTEFARRHAGVRSQLQAWLAEAWEAQWRTPEDIQQRYAGASFLPANRVVFNLKGGNYRMVVKVGYQLQIVIVERVGTHAEYSKWKL